MTELCKFIEMTTDPGWSKHNTLTLAVSRILGWRLIFSDPGSHIFYCPRPWWLMGPVKTVVTSMTVLQYTRVDFSRIKEGVSCWLLRSKQPWREKAKWWSISITANSWECAPGLSQQENRPQFSAITRNFNSANSLNEPARRGPQTSHDGSQFQLTT